MAKKKSQPQEMLVFEEEVVAPAYEVDESVQGQLSPVEALMGVVIQPKATFERMRDAARGHWWVVAVLAILALVLLSIATVPIQAEAARGALEAQQESTETTQELSEEQQAQMQQVQDIVSSQAVLGGISVGFGIIGLAISYLIRAGFVFLLGLALGGRATFKQVWRMAVWTTLPDVLRTVVSAITTFATGSPTAPGLSYMLTSEEINALPYVDTLLQSIDIYLVWSLALLWVGLLVTSQLSRGKSAVVALAYWLFTLAIMMGFVALGQALGSAFGAG
jgi:hypothetical protein